MVTGVLAELLTRACNPLHSPPVRRLAWDAYEVECWYNAVHCGRLRLRDLDHRISEHVYHLIVERNAQRRANV